MHKGRDEQKPRQDTENPPNRRRYLRVEHRLVTCVRVLDVVGAHRNISAMTKLAVTAKQTIMLAMDGISKSVPGRSSSSSVGSMAMPLPECARISRMNESYVFSTFLQ